MTVFWSSGHLCSTWTQVLNTGIKHTPLSSWAENVSSWPHSGIFSVLFRIFSIWSYRCGPCIPQIVIIAVLRWWVCGSVGFKALEGFWSSRQVGWDQSQPRALTQGGTGVHGLGAVRGQDTAVLAHTARDWQPSLVPHGFSEGQLYKEANVKRKNTDRERK